MSRTNNFTDLQSIIAYQFKDISLLERALSHASLTMEGAVRSLERLEFLGDRVLGLLTAEELWRRYPDMDEGGLAPRLNALVRKESCAEAAQFFQLPDFIRLSKSEEQAGGRDKIGILGDVCEALLGAVYIDGGLEAARMLYDAFWIPNFERLIRKYRDAKTELQEWAQSHGLDVPSYKELKREGPSHAPIFTIKVKVQGYDSAQAKGPSKREAQMEAAERFLVREGIWEAENG